MIWLAVAAGGALGATARHALGLYATQRFAATAFPTGIFIINVLGSFAIGVLAGAMASNRLSLTQPVRAFLIVGFLGGFTTFSSFSLDTLALARDGHPGQAMLNVAGQVGLSLLGVWVGFRLAE
jgi:CrcB protein